MRLSHVGFAILFVTAAFGCSSSSSGGAGAAGSTGASPTSATIGAEGGTLTGSDGIALDVPAGALTDATAITVTPATGLAALPSGITAAGSAYTFTPDGLTFAKPVTIRVPTTSPSAMLYVLAGGASTWTPVAESVDAGGFVTASITHFSSYQAAAGSGAGGAGGAGAGGSGTAGSGTAGSGTAGTGAGGATGGPVSSGCQTCAQSACGSAVNACTKDAGCGACIKTNYADPSCKANAAWVALSACVCTAGSCMANCTAECAPLTRKCWSSGYRLQASVGNRPGSAPPLAVA